MCQALLIINRMKWGIIMYNYIEVIKFNDNYFEKGDVVVVTKNNGTVVVGSVIIGEREGESTSKYTIVLDVSEKYHQKREYISVYDIENIQKVC